MGNLWPRPPWLNLETSNPQIVLLEWSIRLKNPIPPSQPYSYVPFLIKLPKINKALTWDVWLCSVFCNRSSIVIIPLLEGNLRPRPLDENGGFVIPLAYLQGDVNGRLLFGISRITCNGSQFENITDRFVQFFTKCHHPGLPMPFKVFNVTWKKKTGKKNSWKCIVEKICIKMKECLQSLFLKWKKKSRRLFKVLPVQRENNFLCIEFGQVRLY